MFGLRLLTLSFGNQLMNELRDVVANELEAMQKILETSIPNRKENRRTTTNNHSRHPQSKHSCKDNNLSLLLSNV
jgi:hypothetical protein